MSATEYVASRPILLTVTTFAKRSVLRCWGGERRRLACSGYALCDGRRRLSQKGKDSKPRCGGQGFEGVGRLSGAVIRHADRQPYL